MSATLREAFLQALEPERRATAQAWPQLDAQLAAWRTDAGQAHGLDVDDARLGGALANAWDDPATTLEVGDLYLAAACADGDPAAIRRFEAEYGPLLDRAVAKNRSLGVTPAQFRQLALDRLLVAEGTRPAKITSYRGQGRLGAWVRVTAARLVVDLSRRLDRATDLDAGLAERITAAEDTELDFLRGTYGEVLDAAFEHAIARLEIRQRNLLRQRYLHGISPDTLAKAYGVHRSTMFVWLDRSRTTLLTLVREGLAARVPGDQLESIVHLLGSRLDVSVRRILDSRLESEG